MSVDIYIPGLTLDDDMNIANGNFRRLADLIGLDIPPPGEGLIGEIYELAKVREQVIIVLQGVAAMPDLDAGTEPRELHKDDISAAVDPVGFVLAHGLGARVIDCGWPPGYIKQRLGQLLRLIEYAIREGKPLRYS